MNKKTDLRVLRTQQSIRKAFYELLQEKGYEAITIQDLADRAMINRNTFYLHHQSKPDLLNTCMDELLGEVKKAIVLCPINARPYRISMLETVMQAVLEHVSRNASFYRVMLNEENRIYPFRTKLETILKDKLNEGWNPAEEPSHPEVSRELLLEYLVSSFMGVVIWWVKSDLSLPASDVSAQFSRIAAYGYLKAAGVALEETHAL